MSSIPHFDSELQRLETIRLYLGLELEKIEEQILETKKARIKQLKKEEVV